MVSISSPYINTCITTTISLPPNTLNNEFEKHILENITINYLGKCYPKYGFINKIHGIEKYSDGTITKYTSTGDIRIKLSFACNVCYPRVNSYVVGTVDSIRDPMITVKIGNSIIALVDKTRGLNSDNFKAKAGGSIYGVMIDETKDGEKAYGTLSEGDHVVVRINHREIIPGQKRILAAGYIDRRASDEEYRQQVESEFRKEYVEDFKSS